MAMNFFVDYDAAIEHPGILVELPTREVVADTRVVMPFAAAANQSGATAAKIMMERMSQAERFVLLRFQTRMKPTDIIRDISGQKAVFLSLNLLLQTLAVVRSKRRFCECSAAAQI